MSAETGTESHSHLLQTWLVLLLSIIVVVAATLALSGLHHSVLAEPTAPDRTHSAPAPSPGPMAAAFTHMVTI